MHLRESLSIATYSNSDGAIAPSGGISYRSKLTNTKYMYVESIHFYECHDYYESWQWITAVLFRHPAFSFSPSTYQRRAWYSKNPHLKTRSFKVMLTLAHIWRVLLWLQGGWFLNWFLTLMLWIYEISCAKQEAQIWRPKSEKLREENLFKFKQITLRLLLFHS